MTEVKHHRSNAGHRIREVAIFVISDRSSASLAQHPRGIYYIASDRASEALAIAFGDTRQLIALKLLGGQAVFIEKPLYR